jgi:hypothetical protein
MFAAPKAFNNIHTTNAQFIFILFISMRGAN